MNNQEDSKVAEINNKSARQQGVGNILREAREKLGMSVNDVANRIKFAPKQIESLEADDYVRLPEAAFVRGFVRSYARLLQLDPTVLLASLPTSHVPTSSAQPVKSVDIPMPTAFTARRHNVIWLAAALVVALSLAIFERVHDRSTVANKAVVKNEVEPLELPKVATDSATDPLTAPVSDNTSSDNSSENQVESPAENVADTRKPSSKPADESVVQVTETKPKPKQEVIKTEVHAAQAATSRQTEVKAAVRVAPAASVAVQKPVAPQAVAAAPAHGRPTPVVDEQPKVNNDVNATEHALRIELDEDAWVEVKDGSDKLLISKMHRAGSLIRVAGKAPMLVTLGNARAVRLFDNGKKIKLEKYTTAEVAKVKLK
jgi:cytoskeleton protein RodZ